MTVDRPYAPLMETLRLYAGWLLACVTVLTAAAAYQATRDLPVEFAALDEWIASPLALQILCVTFLVLLLSDLHRALSGGFWKGLALACIGFAVFVAFRMNM